ncbi:nicotinate phosphoribosyltransferase [Deferribacter autotrophicus]|uniref:nicotinate phosphoribosyltransferase n=1 Tax=Deferribacter autotrophicus TaxID=500465 RepID=A0A5A8F409_9BACT|nr:nicotinate phosphoribosyltransferase [Deferribacter autotrophicus]KAA0258628.1 nicotinate phosphoribosyltransferase [Deferribacter autotrophicus]
MFDIPTKENILNGLTTDVYFLRTEEVLRKCNINKKVAMEVAQKGMPKEYPFGLFTGLYNVLKLLEGKPLDVYAIPEGNVFFENTPVMTIVGNYLDFGIYETAILGFICHSSGITTKAAKCKIAAEDKIVLSFGARRVHPAISGMVDKYAYIGGCDGFSVVFAEKLIGKEASGTVPHALIILIGDNLETMKLFDAYIDKDVKRIALVDTFGDERFETLRVAEYLKERLYGVRLDTPSSRRGSLKKIAEEIRWELDIRGYNHVKLFASGGLDEENIKDLKSVVDGFGVGTSISNAKVMDYSMDIVEVDGKPLSKKGKMSGFKYVYQCDRCLNQTYSMKKDIELFCDCGEKMKMITKKVMENGKILIKEDIEDIRNRVLSQYEGLRRFLT